MNMPAVVTWDSEGRRMQIERFQSHLLLTVENSGLSSRTRLDTSDARAVRRYLTQWLSWIDKEGVPDA